MATAEVCYKRLLDSTFWCSLIGLRREIHMHPEPGFQEVRTQRRVREVLTTFAGIPEDQIRVCAITGLVVDIRGTGEPKAGAAASCVALRSDLDALTMREGNNGLPYRSRNEGVAHMCGHDGHIAALVGVAILLQRRVDRIPSNLTVRLLFQPAEESTPPGTAGYDYDKTGGGGAVPMIMENVLDGVDEVYGWHNWPAWPLGDIRVKEGPVMAHTCVFKIVIQGRGGHGSQPQACVDPVVCGASVVSALQTIVSRSLPSYANAVVTVAQFHAGERDNVIPDTATLSGTIRDVDEEAFATIKRAMHNIVNGICKGFGCQAEIEISSLYPTLVNHAAQVKVVEKCAGLLTGSMALKLSGDGLPMLGGEDFAFYLHKRPGCFFFLGTRELLLSGLAAHEGGEDKPRSNCMCHGTTYDFNDNVLLRAVLMFVRIVEDRFGVDLYTQDEIVEGSFSLTTSCSDDGPQAKRRRDV
eukprot:CAMPEP_0117544914 /NCGR_PEP_ID=MMETSP0784-20121206/45824_1 /TAXON_ID=39447 /ORGANISM="" /LENGTH=468 /DNA_ID=CAMNT_0005341743 /DNA_START=15 /DNA_END=1421 /DNA_ORIENTATION=-